MKNIFIGVNITSNELVEQSFVNDCLPPNYEVKTYIGTAAFEKALRMTKRRVLKVFDIQGLNEKLNPYFDMQSQTNIPLPKDTVFTVLSYINKKPTRNYEYSR